MPNARPLSRRVLVTGTAGGLVAGGLTACGTREGGSTPAAGPSPAPASDSGLVEEMGKDIAAFLGRARGTAKVPGLRPLVQPFARLHAAHLERFGWNGRVPTGGEWTAARESFLAAERRLQADLVRAAGQAESGALAQVLASMAAAVAQQLAVS